jgi:cytidylate kinase
LKKITVAIDGHSSTGKSTLAKELARALGYVYVDSGAMYRCVALYAIKNDLYNGGLQKQALINRLDDIKISFVLNPIDQLNHTFLNGADVEAEIRKMEVSEKVSEVAAISEVRKYLVEIQQEMGKAKGVVMDGRDIGTVVFPDAELKVFMTASARIRAKRRYEELLEKGEQVDFKAVLENVTQRDKADSTRADSPLIIADDAKELDNSDLTRDEQFAIVLNWAKQAIES